MPEIPKPIPALGELIGGVVGFIVTAVELLEPDVPVQPRQLWPKRRRPPRHPTLQQAPQWKRQAVYRRQVRTAPGSSEAPSTTAMVSRDTPGDTDGVAGVLGLATVAAEAPLSICNLNSLGAEGSKRSCSTGENPRRLAFE